MKNILVTGGAGFIGSNLILHLLEQEKEARIINLDALTYAGNLEHLSEVQDHPRYVFIHGDIRDRILVESLFKEYNIEGVYHLAAESHVDNSIANPSIFINTNVNGTFNLLQAAYKHWMDAPFETKEGLEHCRFLHISTDEVYGSLGAEGLFTEDTPYAPSSPYSASKASSDMLVRSYFHTYGMNVVITNCSNNYGPHQHDEKLIPTVIRKALHGAQIPIYGDGKNVRDWLFVSDHCSGLHLAFEQGAAGRSYNIGGNNERNNNYIAERICTILDGLYPKNEGSYTDQIAYVQDRAGHDFRYAIDAARITTELGWQPDEVFETGILKTVAWYAERYRKAMAA